MKKLIYCIVNLLEVALIIGAYLINYFTPKKMGMIRFVSYKNMMWEELYNLQSMKLIAILIVVLLTIITILFYFAKKRNLNVEMIGFTLIISSIYVWFTAVNSVDTYKAFYFISPLLGLSALLQILKTLISILLKKTNK